MKKMLFLLTAAVLSFATAQAQTTQPGNRGNYQGRGMGQGREQRTPEQRADMQAQRLTKQLGLNADQQGKVRTIFLAEANEMAQARAQMTPGNVDHEAMRQKMQEARGRYDAQLQGVLTPEQFAKYTTLRDNRMERVEEYKEAKKDGKVKIKPAKGKAKVKA
jgi:Spy/CpxP family protein refolding chaperone